MDGSYRLLAAQYIRKQTRRLAGQLAGVRQSDDIEYVHQARVASRRLRAGLRIFADCFGRKQRKRWRKRVRRLTEGLGPARDRDVQIEFVQGVLSGLQEKAYRPGVARLLLRLQQSRRAVQPQVVEAADRFEAGGTAEEMLAWTEKTRSKLKKRHFSLQSPFVFARADEHVSDRLNELMEYEDSLGDPRDYRQHHAMRIAGKRLRYTIEICQPAYQGRLDEFVKAVKTVQSLLGDVHDCDVWVDDLATFLEAERERTVAYFGHARPFRQLKVGLEYLRQERQQHREQVFGQLVGYWQELNQDGLWERLVQTVRAPLGPSPGSEPPNEGPARETESDPKPSVGGHGKKPFSGDGKGRAPSATEPPADPLAPDGRTGSRQEALQSAAGPEGNAQ